MNKCVEQLLNDPPEARWRAVRALGRADAETVSQTCEYLNQLLLNDPERLLSDEMVRERVQLAVRMCGGPSPYEQPERVCEPSECIGIDEIPFPVVDFHVHPKRLDNDLVKDFRNANAKAIVLATDTDPADIDRAEVVEHIRKTYEHSDISRQMGFDFLLGEVRKNLRSVTHYSNQDILDLVTDYPDMLIGFGSIDLSKDERYVRQTLEWITDNELRGIKLLPFSQFFDPAESENADIMMEFCAANDLIVLSHTGCSAGIFESPYLNMYSRPSRWRNLASKYPTVPIVLAHFGAYSAMAPGIWFNEAVELMPTTAGWPCG